MGLKAPHKIVWGEFNLEAFEGYLKSTSIDAKNRTINFQWRGRETGKGEITFDDTDTLSITFLDDEAFKGEMSGDYFKRCEISASMTLTSVGTGISRKRHRNGRMSM